MRLVLISLDAVFSRDADFLLSLPNLGALAGRGVFCDRVQTIYPTLTYPVHTSLVTGCYPNRHGIGHNELFMPAIKPGRRLWYWDASHIRSDTLFTRAKMAGRTSAAILWPVTGHSGAIRYNLPEVLALPGENQLIKALRFGSAWWMIKNELLFGSKRKGKQQPQLDEYAALVAAKLIKREYAPGERFGPEGDINPSRRDEQRHMPDILALHLVDCDDARHRYGTDSIQARQAMIRLDLRVGQIMAALLGRKAMDETVLAVVSDHGQADVLGTLPLDSWLLANAVPARAQTLGLGAYLHIKRGDYLPVLKALKDNMAKLHIKHIYTREELRFMQAPEDILLAVEPEEGIMIVDDEQEEVPAATHGFGVNHPGAQCLMWLTGPMFPADTRLESCKIVDIAPTLAYAVGLSLPGAQGRVLEEIIKNPAPEDAQKVDLA